MNYKSLTEHMALIGTDLTWSEKLRIRREETIIAIRVWHDKPMSLEERKKFDAYEWTWDILAKEFEKTANALKLMVFKAARVSKRNDGPQES